MKKQANSQIRRLLKDKSSEEIMKALNVEHNSDYEYWKNDVHDFGHKVLDRMSIAFKLGLHPILQTYNDKLRNKLKGKGVRYQDFTFFYKLNSKAWFKGHNYTFIKLDKMNNYINMHFEN